MLYTVCAPDLVRAFQRALTVTLEPGPSWLRPAWYLSTLNIQIKKSLFSIEPQFGINKVCGRRIPVPYTLHVKLSGRHISVYSGQLGTLHLPVLFPIQGHLILSCKGDLKDRFWIGWWDLLQLIYLQLGITGDTALSLFDTLSSSPSHTH
jgi:hypothetical protein